MKPSPSHLQRLRRACRARRAPHRAGVRPASWHRSGFTLIEVIVSISVLVMLMTIAWGSYSMASHTQQQTQTENDRLHAVEQAMRRLIRELSMAFIIPHNEDGESSQLEVRYRTIFKGDDDEISFTTLAHQRMFRDDKVGDQAEVSYRVASVRGFDGEQSRAVIRRLDAPIDDDPEDGGLELVLIEGIKDFKLEYWDDEKAEIAAGADGWVDDWDHTSTDQLNRLPSRMRITLVIDHPLDPSSELTFTSQAEIRLTKPIEFE